MSKANSRAPPSTQNSLGVSQPLAVISSVINKGDVSSIIPPLGGAENITLLDDKQQQNALLAKDASADKQTGGWAW